MRRLLALLAVASVGAVLTGPALSARPYVAQAVEFDQAIAREAGASGAGGGWRSAVIRAPERFDLVGLSWRGADDLSPSIRVRDATSDRWSRWTAMADDHVGGGGAEPVWAGGADALQLRLRRVPRGLRAHFVNSTGSATAPRRALTALRRAAHAAFVALVGTPALAQDANGAPPIVPREAWGAEQCGPPRAPPVYGTVEMAFVHHTVDANDYGPQDSAAIVLAICRYHRDVKGWHDIGYNFLVDRYGQVFEGRAGGIAEAVVGAQAEGYNAVSTGAVHAMAQLLSWKLTLHGVPVRGQVSVLSRGGPTNRYRAGTPVTFERISGHRDGDSTTCPGSALYAQLPAIRSEAAQLAALLAAPIAPSATVTLDALDATIDFPQPARLSGRVVGTGGAPVAGGPVSIQGAGTRGFVTLARAVTGDDGTWSAQLPTRYTRTIRAVVALADGGVATSPPVVIAVAPRIAVLAPRHVTAGRPFVVRGTVRPLRAGLRLVVTRKGSDGAFHTIALVALRAAGGAFRATLELRRPALHRLRVESPGDPFNAAGRSPDTYLRAVHPQH
ncbi:MAG: N-acetylmuramoyl-L-alanine amidase [Actinobacteria bacterium]|nr:N-acetylmuramoyl-L-alanine amidase [Actinomycetota bacterium]